MVADDARYRGCIARVRRQNERTRAALGELRQVTRVREKGDIRRSRRLQRCDPAHAGSGAAKQFTAEALYDVAEA